MAVGFLKFSGMKDIMASSGASKAASGRAAGTAQNQAAQNPQKSDKSQKADVANMNTSDLLKYVYENKSTDNNDIKLPYRVQYDDLDISTSGKKFDDVVKEICEQTSDSKAKVETELKKKYAGGGGASLNMNA